MFILKSHYHLITEQKKAVTQLYRNIQNNQSHQVLLGVTGSGKTFTIANLINKLNIPTLIISHNKTLAGQLYQEMRDFFPSNSVNYFVSYYDYYQPEAYIPQRDLYIEKEATVNEYIDKLRLATTSNILTRNDVIVVASVSCIYNLGSPQEYQNFILNLSKNQKTTPETIIKHLITLQYTRSAYDFKRGTFRIRGDNIDVYPSDSDIGIRLTIKADKLINISQINTLTGEYIKKNLTNYLIFSTKHYIIDRAKQNQALNNILNDLKTESDNLKTQKKFLEAERLIKRVSYDIEIIREIGYVNGIENYSRYFDNRQPGDPPYSLINYFNYRYANQWLLVIDESHMTLPQLHGMYAGDYSRKKILTDYGFRLKSAFDNRPLKFPEFLKITHKTIYLSATPKPYEITLSKNRIVEQLVRPTGVIEPQIIIRSTKDQIKDLISEIKIAVLKNHKILVSSITKRIAEDLTDYLKNQDIKAEYLHSDIKTLDRSEIINNLRNNKYDVIVGINLLREGLDIPEVALIAILDADKEGFLRDRISLIQTMGRAARNIDGKVIIYTDKMTDSIKNALSEVSRRRTYQIRYNKKHRIIPKNIIKSMRQKIIETAEITQDIIPDSIDIDSLTPIDKKQTIKKLKKLMKKSASDLNFEKAIEIREIINKLK